MGIQGIGLVGEIGESVVYDHLAHLKADTEGRLVNPDLVKLERISVA